MLTTGISPAPDPAAALTEQLHHATVLRWRAVLAYREAMAARGEAVVFARYGGELDSLMRLAGTPMGGELVILGRTGDNGRPLWDAVPGAGVPAHYGDTVLHGDGADLEAWQVYGRFRRIMTAFHPEAPRDLVHVLHQLEGSAR
jgi:hypothetical protein